MTDQDLELLITVVVAADDDRQARDACRELVAHTGGRIVASGDCSDEEPGCWAVTVSVVSAERADYHTAAALARAVRQFVRSLRPEFPVPPVSCEPPTAWTVLDDPELIDEWVPGAERLLVEAWAGGDPHERGAPPAEPEPEPEPAAQPTPTPANATGPDGEPVRLWLRVDVVADHTAGAEWQARAVASRIVQSGAIQGVTARDGVLSVQVDLGTSRQGGERALRTAVSSLGRTGWSPIRSDNGVSSIGWTAETRPSSGITALELRAVPEQGAGAPAAPGSGVPPGPAPARG
ncbi:hypothetical protein [Goodfellowiella coeruleoviolacea]|uniref:Uncharacterized protein n=1 Tax=Goodfellowiella coeruleoviolacea TaxID=334858 RepID=A0AAE3GJ51_9PSEU|nr:hypothetical protein [Goodfellowiella coeruleoviolacea]MCP2169172.1 hypothetical protein [Goodfellowiella coeruleoviolacea]